MSLSLALLTILGSSLTLTSALLTNATYFYNRAVPWVVAHRGASGIFPEHTLGAYSSAFFTGADWVEIDL
jgi:glycerophosphoryl diester phosphodiesterase